MNRGRDPPVSLCEKKFILEAIKESKRVDGREIYDYREINVSFGKNPGHVEVTLGRTRVLACVSCQVIKPKPQRPTEGVLFFNVELSPMASPLFEAGRQSNMSVEVGRILERCQKDTRAVDMESLCIIAGQKVWEIRMDLHVLDHCGNITDCASIASITALKHFRRPDVTVVGEEATIHPASERDLVPLSVHHMPICFTFGFFWNGEYMLVDPCLEEERVMEGKLVVGMNIHREICVLQVLGGVAVLPEQVMRCTQIAAVKCVEITQMIKNYYSGKAVDLSENFESILQSKRNVEEISSELRSEDLKENEEERLMEVGIENQVKSLGPDTAELVGLGGDSTWEVLDSITNKESSDEDLVIVEQMPDKKESKKSKKTRTKKKENQEVRNDSGSEEEETMQLTKTDITEVPNKSPELSDPKHETLDSATKETQKERTVGSGSNKTKKKSKTGGNSGPESSRTKSKKKGQN